ncbi:MAG: hypothetical protein JO104_02825, partial [Candidatus Eremiobacteraeota bacterium]|nr:hypothetical protein [Candidatus Eremiobacteraeota bacterium]
MFADVEIASALATMLDQIDAPAAPIDTIKLHIAAVQPVPQRRFPSYLSAAAALAIVVLALPKVAPGLAQTVEARVEAMLHWTPPPPPPASIESAMRSQTGTLAEAQSRASFTIVLPSGLPAGAALEKIVTMPTAVYSKTSHEWSVGSAVVWFLYRRAAGRSFRP